MQYFPVREAEKVTKTHMWNKFFWRRVIFAIALE